MKWKSLEKLNIELVSSIKRELEEGLKRDVVNSKAIVIFTDNDYRKSLLAKVVKEVRREAKKWNEKKGFKEAKEEIELSVYNKAHITYLVKFKNGKVFLGTKNIEKRMDELTAKQYNKYAKFKKIILEKMKKEELEYCKNKLKRYKEKYGELN